jgi:hypothetical protein
MMNDAHHHVMTYSIGPFGEGTVSKAASAKLPCRYNDQLSVLMHESGISMCERVRRDEQNQGHPKDSDSVENKVYVSSMYELQRSRQQPKKDMTKS